MEITRETVKGLIETALAGSGIDYGFSRNRADGEIIYSTVCNRTLTVCHLGEAYYRAAEARLEDWNTWENAPNLTTEIIADIAEDEAHGHIIMMVQLTAA